jgi:hypothetical protein
MMTIIQYQKNSPKDTKILSHNQCFVLDANLEFAGFRSQKKTEFRGPKLGRSVLGQIHVVSAVRFVKQTTPRSGKTTALAVEERNNTTG